MGSTNVLVSSPGKQPLFSFGVISDVQCADIPDGHSFIGVPRYYRHSIRVLQRAVKKVSMAMPTMSFSPGPEHRIVVLDGYGISAIGWPRGHPKTLQACIGISREEESDRLFTYNCVKACLSGHDHKGGHSTDSNGIQYHGSFEAACPPDTDAFHIDVYDNRLLL
ncbi:hypothetical protein POTOM_050595 [Populus tomentosa]|uniref:Uncharacterized protein n=1 Tax=Populus tomentosa TaxID=118781 RepID=A0A8X7YAQ9_POPTO|nr:hypothetical protein POTOM_050595 [Populus tomentosa]